MQVVVSAVNTIWRLPHPFPGARDGKSAALDPGTNAQQLYTKKNPQKNRKGDSWPIAVNSLVRDSDYPLRAYPPCALPTCLAGDGPFILSLV